METVAIRDLSGEMITRATGVVGVTSRGALVGVIVPWTTEILQRTSDRDEAEHRKKADQAEAEIASGRPMTTLSDFLGQGAPARARPDPEHVSIRELSGARLEQAAREGAVLLITSDRVPKALFIPITPAWVERLVGGAVTRFLEGDHSRDWPAPASVTSFPGGEGDVEIARSARARVPLSTGYEFLRQRAIGIRIFADAPGDRRRLHGVLTDMLARPKGVAIEREVENIDETIVVSEILSLIEALRAQLTSDEQLVGVGLEVGGHVYKGRVVYSPNAHWRQFPLEEQLRANLGGLPVVVENDANTLAIYESLFEGLEEESLAVFLLTHLGIGCGLLVNGHIFRGPHGMAGEVGHMPLRVRNDDHDLEFESRCRCGNHDCLEAMATPGAIERELRRAGFHDGYEAALGDPDDENVRSVFEFAGSALGHAVATIINIMNPSAIVIYGSPDLLGPSRELNIGNAPRTTGASRHYVSGMVEAIKEHAFSSGAYVCRFIVRTAVDDYSARAAAACLINRINRARASVQSGRSGSLIRF